MFNKKVIPILMLPLFAATSAAASETAPITGTVESKCAIFTDVQGVYGNPSPNLLSTARADGGVLPVIRYDVASADYYKARITHPNSFSSSPSLIDFVEWQGSTTVKQVSDPLMSGYESDKIEYNNATEFDLTVAGTVWFEVSSSADYGFNKAFPAGNYTALVTAECIAK
jgi:hypothetical protein